MSKRKKYYLEYLKSDHWKLLREQTFARDGHQCRQCGYGKRLQGHHVVYRKDLYACTIADIITLCRFCHEKEHRRLKKLRKEKRRGLRATRKHNRSLIRLLLNFSADEAYVRFP